MRGVFLLGVILLVISWGFRAPILFVLGYVWASIFTPQLVAYSVVTSIPISFILAALAFGGFLLLPKVDHIQWRAQSIVTGIFVVWMTITLWWAVVPDEAYSKWDWAIKSMAFTIIIPHFIGGRREFEAFLWTILLSGMAHCIPFGLKMVLSGGGYDMPLGLVESNSGYGEGSTLAMFSVSLIPISIYLYLHQTLFVQKRLIQRALGVFIVILVLASVGTYARTAVVCLLVLALCLIYYSKRRLLGVFFVISLAVLVYPFIETGWVERMSTIDSGTDASAMGRVAVWKWVVEYILMHPLGGSFDMYRINNYSMSLADGSVLHVANKAFHSIYFEVLGEGGIPGFLMFIALIALTLSAFMRYKKVLLATGEVWMADAGRYLLIAALIYLCGGAFIGVAFQSYFYYLVALSAAYMNLGARYAPK